MTFDASTYANFVSQATEAQDRLFLQYMGPRDDFDIIIVGSGIGGGILADDLADRLGGSKRILSRRLDRSSIQPMSTTFAASRMRISPSTSVVTRTGRQAIQARRTTSVKSLSLTSEGARSSGRA